MRTTIRMNSTVAEQAKEFAAETGRSFTQLVEESVCYFMNQRHDLQREPVEILTFGKKDGPPVTEEALKAHAQQLDDEELEHHLHVMAEADERMEAMRRRGEPQRSDQRAGA